ncbi:MAG: alpha/beta hydrolase [Burkholderiaceae bacterium]|jgi:pimeloyl-ACP methyl ester carboxylesterase
MTLSIQDQQSATLSNGMRLHYASAGERGRDLIVFVHGFPEAWFAFEETLLVFGRDHFAVAPDLRGFNLSGKPVGVEHYRPKHVVDDLRLLIADLGYSKATVVAHDWGGAIAWNLAIHFPQVVERLIIINAPHPFLFMRELAQSADQQKASAYMNWLRAEGSEKVLASDDFARLDAVFRGPKGEHASWYTPAVRERYHRMWSVPGEGGSHSLSGSVNYYRSTPLHPPLAGQTASAPDPSEQGAWMVRVPVRVIWGEGDVALLPGLLNGLEGLCPDLRVTRVPEATHWIIHEMPERVHELIRESLAN